MIDTPCRHVPYSDFKEKEGWTSGEDTDGGDAVGVSGDTGGWSNADAHKAALGDEAAGNNWPTEDAGRGWE